MCAVLNKWLYCVSICCIDYSSVKHRQFMGSCGIWNKLKVLIWKTSTVTVCCVVSLMFVVHVLSRIKLVSYCSKTRPPCFIFKLTVVLFPVCLWGIVCLELCVYRVALNLNYLASSSSHRMTPQFGNSARENQPSCKVLIKTPTWGIVIDYIIWQKNTLSLHSFAFAATASPTLVGLIHATDDWAQAWYGSSELGCLEKE